MKCKYCEEEAVYACTYCGKGLCWDHVKLKVVCSDCIPQHEELEVKIRGGGLEDKPFVETFKKVLCLSDEDVEDNFSPNHYIFISEVDNIPVGFAILAKTSEVQGWLSTMGVLPRFQRRGIGTRLVKTITDKSRELRLKQLVVTTSNEDVPALMLCMKHGFKIVSVKHDVYEKYGICGFGVPGFDELRLEMKL